jgi:hypothetical protein
MTDPAKTPSETVKRGVAMDDLVDILGALTNYIQNERVRSYNEGVDNTLAPHVIEVVQLQPAEDCPGLWIGFRTEGDRERSAAPGEMTLNDDFTWRTRAEKDAVVRYWWRVQRGRCHLCREPMEPYSQAAVSPWAATIEHLKPKREGGPDTAGNIRLAHRWCNNVLGALWSMNRDRAFKGLPPLSADWALTNELGKLRVRKQAAPQPTPLPPARPRKTEKLPKGTLAAMLANGSAPLPRGATLSNATTAPITPARRMTAIETAQWLRHSAKKGGQSWPLA